MGRITLLALLGAIATAAYPDAPLRPAEDYSVQLDGVVVTATVDPPVTIFQPALSPSWEIPVWARWFYMSPDGRSVLVLSDSGSLLGTTDPDQIVATRYHNDAMTLYQLDITLAETMNPAYMPVSTSHYVWLDGIVSKGDVWELTLSDDTTIKIAHR